jgi:hypothetical protein
MPLSKMNAADIKRIVARELAKIEHVENAHGINRENVHKFLVEPFAVITDPDDTTSAPREMWVVLQGRGSAEQGYVIVYDPQENSWGVAEFDPNSTHRGFTQVVSAPSLGGALNGM